MKAHARWWRWSCVGLLVSLHCAALQAQSVIVITEPWLRPAKAAASTEAFMEVMSSAGATLVGARADVASTIALVNPDGKAVKQFAHSLPARHAVALKPGASRLLLRNVARPLRLGDRVAIVLLIREGDGVIRQVDVDAEVRRRSPTDDHRRPHTH